MKITLQQIAAGAGVSPSTVSRVMNRQPGVDADIRRRVVAIARELGYRQRVGPRRNTIAVIIPGHEEIEMRGYLSYIITALTNATFLRGYRLELLPSHDLELLDTEVISGAISTMFIDGLEKEWGKHYHLPLVCINTSSYHLDNVYSVHSNERQGMRLALDLLVRQGHRRIGLLTTGEPATWCNRERLAGFLSAASALGVNACARNGVDNIYEQLGELVRQGISAIICTGENTGMTTAYALRSFGYRIPEDLSLISHEQEGVSQYCLPRHTTIRQNFRQLSETALDLLEQLLAGDHQAADAFVDCELIERDTVAAPPAV